MDQRTQDSHGALGTDRGRTELYDSAGPAAASSGADLGRDEAGVGSEEAGPTIEQRIAALEGRLDLVDEGASRLADLDRAIDHGWSGGRTEAVASSATGDAYLREETGTATSDQPAGDAPHFDKAGADQGGEDDGAAAAEDASAADAPTGNGGLFFPEVLEGLRSAEASARQAGRQGLARAYEDLRIKAVANLDIMLGHAQLAQAALKWNGEDFATISTALVQADRCLAEVRDAVLGRMQLNEFDAATRAAHAAAGPGATQATHDAPSA